MKLLTATVLSLPLLASACIGANQARVTSGSYVPSAASSKESQTITITRSGTQPSKSGPAEYVTGSARIDPLFQAEDPAHTSAAYVTFKPGGSVWHTHPLGQILIVAAGSGRLHGVKPTEISEIITQMEVCYESPRAMSLRRNYL
jgi:hypothetical protein